MIWYAYHAPLRWMAVEQVQSWPWWNQIEEKREVGKSINKLIEGIYELRSKQTILNLFSDKVIVERSMFHVWVKDKIRVEICCPNIIIINNWLMKKGNTHFGEGEKQS